VLIHKLDMSAIEHEVERLKKSGVGEDSNIPFFKWEEGDNTIRIMPPFSSKGRIFTRRIQHFQLPPESSICSCLYSYSGEFDNCYVCDAIEELHKKFPGVLDLGRQEPKESFCYNVIDRADEATGVQIASFTPRLHNWVCQQIQDKRIGDVTDVEQGFDIKVTKKVTHRGKKEFTTYNQTLMPRPCKLHDDTEIVNMWLNDVWDLDKVICTAPDEEKLADMHKLAVAMTMYYINKNTDSSKVRDAVRSSTSERVEKSQSKDVHVPENNDKPDYSTMPECYAGRDNPTPHDDGTIGPKEIKKCTFCMHEVPCAQAAKTKKK
jgi:hypothetical protein